LIPESLSSETVKPKEDSLSITTGILLQSSYVCGDLFFVIKCFSIKSSAEPNKFKLDLQLSFFYSFYSFYSDSSCLSCVVLGMYSKEGTPIFDRICIESGSDGVNIEGIEKELLICFFVSITCALLVKPMLGLFWS